MSLKIILYIVLLTVPIFAQTHPAGGYFAISPDIGLSSGNPESTNFSIIESGYKSPSGLNPL